MLEKTQYYLNSEIEILKKADIKKLAAVLEYHSDLYHNKDASIISDSEYDLLLKKLQDLENIF
jgi:NAD-dependent DNA ligase